MNRLLELHRVLKQKTYDELVVDEVVRVQDMLINYFKNNQMEFTNSNIVIYDESHTLVQNLRALAKNSNLTVYNFFHKLIDEPENVLHCLNEKSYIQNLLQLIIPNVDLELKIQVIPIYEYDYTINYSLQFTFNLQDNVNYDGVNHKLVNYLLSVRVVKVEVVDTVKNFTSETFNKICDCVSEKYKNDRDYNEYSLTIYEINALLIIMGAYDKYSTIEYNYEYFLGSDLNIKYRDRYEFTLDQQRVLSTLLGVDECLKFTYNNCNLNIIFDKKLPISDSLLTDCKLKLENIRNVARQTLLEYVEKQKDDIIDTCCHILKCNKSSPSIYRKAHFSLKDSLGIPGFLLCDPEIITPEITETVNNILGTTGISLFIKESFDVYSIDENGDEVSTTPGVLNIAGIIYYNNVYLKLPSVFDF